jgi:hypothetical protein
MVPCAVAVIGFAVAAGARGGSEPDHTSDQLLQAILSEEQPGTAQAPDEILFLYRVWIGIAA